MIREMTRLANGHQAINLGQGMPDFDPPDEVKEAACQAIRNGWNQYAITWARPSLRQAIAAKALAFNGSACDADEHVTVCCGTTECMMAAMLALVDPGDEVIIFQPFYENYGPDALLTGAKPVLVDLHPPHWQFDPDELRRAFSPRTKAVILNTPNNPTGRVFTRQELTLVADLCKEFNAYVLADEIYEYIRFVDAPHISIATLPGMAERTVTISGLSKTFSITGWRLGYCIAPAEVTVGIRRAHDFLTVGAFIPYRLPAGSARTAAVVLRDAACRLPPPPRHPASLFGRGGLHVPTAGGRVLCDDRHWRTHVRHGRHRLCPLDDREHRGLPGTWQ